MSRAVSRLLAGIGAVSAYFMLASFATSAEKAATSIERMKKDLLFLASEECEGRGVETQGINKAADHIAAVFKELGLKPAGTDGSYFQPFTIPGGVAKLGEPNKLSLKGTLGQEIDLPFKKQFTVSGLSGKGKVTAPIVFAGYGLALKGGYDDFQGIDVKDKVVIVLRSAPRSTSKFAAFPDAINQAPLKTKIANLSERKAAAILFVSNKPMADEENDQLMEFDTHARGGGSSVPVFHIHRTLVDQLLANEDVTLLELEAAIDRDLKPRSFEVKGWSAAAETNVERQEVKAKNVVAILEGNGPLANETVVIGAHYDHLGRGEPGTRNKGSTAIHFGADDNGSGSTAVLELARRFAGMKDRQGRRIVFMTFSGEERGLLGSNYYCRNPLLPLKDTVAMINLDMVGRLRADEKTKKDNLEIGGIGSAKNFEALIDELNKKYEFNVKKTRSGTGPSDHTSFFMKDVPVYFFFTGLHQEYHTPSDKAETINFEGMYKIVDMVEELTIKIATTKDRPEFVAIKSTAKSTPGGIPSIRFLPGSYDELEEKGVLVGGVASGGPAEKGGLKADDWIVEIAGMPVKNMDGYMKVMGTQKAGEPIDFTVKRGDKMMKLKITPLPPAMPKG